MHYCLTTEKHSQLKLMNYTEIKLELNEIRSYLVVSIREIKMADSSQSGVWLTDMFR